MLSKRKTALARVVTNEEHSNEFLLTQSFVFHALWLARRCIENKEANVTIAMSVKRKQSVLSIKDKQSTLVRLERGEKGTNLSAEYGVSMQRISDIRVGFIPILFFSCMFLTRRLFDCSHTPEMSLSIIENVTSITRVCVCVLWSKIYKH